jgi:hypothetical protein
MDSSDAYQQQKDHPHHHATGPAFALALPIAMRANEQRSASLPPKRLRANEQSHSQRQTHCEQTSKVPACRLTFARNRCEQSACKASKAQHHPLLVCSQCGGDENRLAGGER